MTQLTPVATDRFSYTNADMSSLVDATSCRSVEAHIASVLDCLWATDVDHCVSYISPSLARITQGCCAITLGMKLSDWLNDHHNHDASQILKSVLNDQACFRDHLATRSFKMGDGHCSLLLSGTPRFDDEGAFLGFVGSITWLPETLIANSRDKQTRLEQELEKNSLAEHVMNAISDPIFAKDEQLRFVLSNKAFAKLYGLEPADLVGKRVEDLSDHTENAHYIASEQAVLDSGEMLEEEQNFHQNNSMGAHIVRKSRITTESGRQFMVGTLIDVSKLKQRSEELDAARASAQLLNDDLQKTLDSLTMGVVLLDSDGRLKTANSTYFQLWNMDRETINVGDSFEQLMEISWANGNKVVPDDEWAAYKKRRLKEIRIGSLDPTEFKLSDGRVFLFSITKLTGEQRLLSYLDVTEARARENALRDAEQRAQIAARSKMEFLSSIGHDIRTPMNGITGMAELLANSDLNMRQRTFVGIIGRSSQALMAIINDIVDFTHIDASTLELDIEPFSLRDIVADLETVLAHNARDKALNFKVDIAPSVPDELLGDKKRFRQVLGNLLSNGIKFTETGSVGLSIDGSEEAGRAYLKVDVWDTGIGVDESRLAGLFAKNDITTYHTNSAKSALGLAIVASLVTLMGGEVAVKSTLGAGSCFTVTLDLPIDQNALFNPGVLPALEGARILILDHDVEAYNCLTHHLKKHGSDVCVIADASIGAIFIEAAQRIGMEIDLVLADQSLLEDHFAHSAPDDVLKTFDITKMLLMTDIDLALNNGGLDLKTNAECLVKPVQTSLAIERIISTLDRRAVDHECLEDVDHHYISAPEVTKAVKVANPDTAPTIIAPEMTMPEQPVEARTVLIAPNIIEENGPIETHLAADDRAQEKQPMDILIAEDNEINQLVYRQILSETPLNIHIVSTGEALFQAFEVMRPRLVLMDLSLPDMDGFAAAQKLRNDHGILGANVPIVGILTPANDESAEQCLAQGMDDSLSKPISPNALLQKILFWLERSAAHKVA